MLVDAAMVATRTCEVERVVKCYEAMSNKEAHLLVGRIVAELPDVRRELLRLACASSA